MPRRRTSRSQYRSRYSRYRTPTISRWRPQTPTIVPIEIRRAQLGIPKPEAAPTPPSPMMYPNQLGSPSLPLTPYFPTLPYYGTGPTGPSGTLQQPVQPPSPAESRQYGSSWWMRNIPTDPYSWDDPFPPYEPSAPNRSYLRAKWASYRQRSRDRERVYFTEPTEVPSLPWPSAGYGYPSYGGGGGAPRDTAHGLGLVNWRIGL